MSLTGPASYLSTTDLFISHWGSANAALQPAPPIALAGGVDVDALGDLRSDLENQRRAVEVARNSLELARAQIETLKAGLLERLNQFNLKLASLAPESPLMALRPKAYSQSDGMGKILSPLDDLADIWQRYDTANTAAPLTLMGGYTLASFTTQHTALRAAYPAWSAAQNGLNMARAERNALQDRIRTILVQYRQRIPAEFPEGSTILATLPRLTPPDGSTPDAATLSGTWNTTTVAADLAWVPITDDSVTTLHLRATAGPEYEADDESIIATVPANAPATWTGNWGLAAPGASASFKLYSLTAEGNERGSNPITITRPAP